MGCNAWAAAAVELLLERGADLDRANNQGMTSLAPAAEEQNSNRMYYWADLAAVVKLLLLKGAKPYHKDLNGLTQWTQQSEVSFEEL